MLWQKPSTFQPKLTFQKKRKNKLVWNKYHPSNLGHWQQLPRILSVIPFSLSPHFEGSAMMGLVPWVEESQEQRKEWRMKSQGKFTPVDIATQLILPLAMHWNSWGLSSVPYWWHTWEPQLIMYSLRCQVIPICKTFKWYCQPTATHQVYRCYVQLDRVCVLTHLPGMWKNDEVLQISGRSATDWIESNSKHK